MIKKTVVCDRCHEAEAKYYTGEHMDVVYCEKCIIDVLNAKRVNCLKCDHCGRGIQNTEHIERRGRHYCSVKCLIEGFYGISSAGELTDTHREYLIANGSGWKNGIKLEALNTGDSNDE